MKTERALTQLAAILSGRVPEAPNWEAILALAGEQLVVTQLYERLKRDGVRREKVPREVWSYLAEARKRTLERNLRLYVTLGDALRALNAAGIEPVLLKGCALWAQTSREEITPQSDRLVSDLDLLVHPAEVTVALGALVDAGFEILKDDRNRPHPTVVFGRPSDVGGIDLHQHTPGPRGIHQIDNVHSHSRRVTLAGGTAKLPFPELQILIFMLHDQFHDGHFWRGGLDFRHLLDVAELAGGPIDWVHISAMCRPPLAAAALATYLRAARHIAGANIPETVVGGYFSQLNFWRQKNQPSWPWVNSGFHRIGLTRNIWERFRF
jgi:hypothetical protein